MNSKERLIATLEGKKHDRVPIFTHIPFTIENKSFKPGPFHGYSDFDNWREKDPAYDKLTKRMEKECDNFFIWRPPCMRNTQFFLSPEYTEKNEFKDKSGKLVRKTIFKQDNIELTNIHVVETGTGHSWETEHFCRTPEDAVKILKLPWKGEPVSIGDFHHWHSELGNRGTMWVTIPSPIQIVCHLFDPTDFLLFSRTEEKLIHKLLETCTERLHNNLSILLNEGVGPIIRFGGAEHATPPLMSPKDFDNLVVHFDKPLVELCKKNNRKVAYHCHGNISHALLRFKEMGVDQTDPVETIPDGDLTLAQARKISEGKITLTGNIQCREIASCTPEEIRNRVKEIIEEAGTDRLIITATGTPLEKMDTRTEENYHSLIDATLEFGKI